MRTELVQVHAVKNANSIFIIPGKNNLIDKINYQNVVFDTSCEMMMLPVPKSLTFDEFCKKYEEFRWSVLASYGTGVIDSLALIIDSKKRMPPFEFKFFGAKEVMKTEQLRFFIDKITAQKLKTLQNKLNGGEIKKIEDYLKLQHKLENEFPESLPNSFEDFVLIGQSIFQNYYLIQLTQSAALIKPCGDLNWKFLLDEIEEKEKLAYEDIEKNFPEFNLLNLNKDLFLRNQNYQVARKIYHL